MTRFLYAVSQVTDPTSNNPTNNSLSLVGWFVGFLIALGVLTVVAWPLLNVKSWTRRNPVREDQLELDSLYNRLETEQLAMNELEFDYDAGGLNDTDYLELKSNSESVISELEQELKNREDNKFDEQSREIPLVSNRETILVTNSTAPKGSSNAINSRRISPVTTTDIEPRHRHTNVKKVIVCSECGTTFKPGDRFCVKCGAPLPIVCQDCGAEIGPDDRFCAKCGATVRR